MLNMTYMLRSRQLTTCATCREWNEAHSREDCIKSVKQIFKYQLKQQWKHFDNTFLIPFAIHYQGIMNKLQNCLPKYCLLWITLSFSLFLLLSSFLFLCLSIFIPHLSFSPFSFSISILRNMNYLISSPFEHFSFLV